MKRTITGFRQDEAGDWVAVLGCGHSQHVRHRPPWQLRPWVLEASGRDAKIGSELDCPLCDMPELPSGAVEYKRTRVFTEDSIPEGLRRDHRTKAGVWARIVVESGRLRLRLHDPIRTFDLTPERSGVVTPMALHDVSPVGPVSFYVAFHRRE